MTRTKQHKMRSVILSFILSLISPKLSTENEISCGAFPVAFAEQALTTSFAPGNLKSGKHYDYNNKTTSCVFRTTIGDYGEGKEIGRKFYEADDAGEGAFSFCSTSSSARCLRPFTARSAVSLRTLCHRYNWKGGIIGFSDKDLNYRHIDFCWKPVRDIEEKLSYRPMIFPSKILYGCPVGVAAPNNSSAQSEKSCEIKKNKAGGLISIALKLDLLFDTAQVQNNEISLPRSIAELFRQKKTTLHSDKEVVTSRKTQSFLISSTSLALSKLQPTIGTSRAAPVIDLTGRWRPAKSLSAQDLIDYGEFLKACCSDKLSYWTRKLLTSSSVISRQEFVVKQSNEGRIVEFIDIHPLSSNVWNRTIVTSMDYEVSSRSMLEEKNPGMGSNNIVKLNSNRSNINHLKDPQGDPIVIEAYWGDNGTVHTSLLRKFVDCKVGNCNGWLKTKRYLYSGKDHFDTPDQKEESRVMIVETTYYPTLYPTDSEMPPKDQVKTNGFIRLDGNGDTTTRMVWKWEQVIGL